MAILSGDLLGIVEIITVFIIENKNWDGRVKDWEKVKKINIQKGTLEILVSSRNYSEKSNFLYISAFIVPIIAGVTWRFLNNVGGDTKIITIKVIFLIGFLLFGIIFGQELSILFNVHQLEKKNNIILKTEYRNLISR